MLVKKMSLVVSGAVIASAMFMNVTAYASVKFSDINGSKWYDEAIIQLANSGFVGGYSDGTYQPDKEMTRAEFVQILYNAFGKYNPYDPATVVDEQFSDVHPTDWYYEAVKFAKYTAIISGIDSTHFGPDQPLTREQAATMIWNTFGFEGSKVKINNLNKLSFGQTPTPSFTDIDRIANWARESIFELNNDRVIGGYPDGTFKPKNNVTRAEIAAMLCNVLKKDGYSFPKVPQAIVNRGYGYGNPTDNKDNMTVNEDGTKSPGNIVTDSNKDMSDDKMKSVLNLMKQFKFSFGEDNVTVTVPPTGDPFTRWSIESSNDHKSEFINSFSYDTTSWYDISNEYNTIVVTLGDSRSENDFVSITLERIDGKWVESAK